MTEYSLNRLVSWGDERDVLPLRARREEVTRDTLKLKEELTMGEKLKKSEKLNLILSELAKLRGEVKLVRDRAAIADQVVKTKTKSAPRRTKKLPKRTGA